MSLRFRSFTCLMVLAVYAHHADTFAINRSTDTTRRADLVSTESFLQVKRELKNTSNANSLGNDSSAMALGVIQRNDSVKNTTDNIGTKPDPVSTVSPTGILNLAASPGPSQVANENANGTKDMMNKTIGSDVKIANASTNTTTPSTNLTTNVTKALLITGNETVTTKSSTDNTSETTTKIVQGEWRTEVNNVSGYSTEPVKTDTTVYNSNVTETTTVGMTQFSTSSLNSSNTNDQTKKVESTERMTGDQNAITVAPYWKKYVEIDRKRNIEREITTSTEKLDLIQSGTAQSISLEKAFNITPNILFANTKTSTTKNSDGSSTFTTVENTKYTSSGLEGRTVTDQSDFTTVNSVTSKRAGFLDFSSRPTLVPNTTAPRVDYLPELPQNLSTTILYPTTSRTTSQAAKDMKSTRLVSQSRLAEDAINEELMKEEVLYNGMRTREDNSPQTNQPAYTEPTDEDKLSVKPIVSEKRNGSLYTVSPNYKPLKKIEVQPPKPFVRNPDDNSWRNESLSSLGIVFKANNSSKPFTQVLKNKTEIELSQAEKNNKSDEQGLRERLEKIAEMRKSKKKKINQFGETVYTDYEESVSEENISSPTPKVATAEVYMNPTTPLSEADFRTEETEKTPPRKGGEEYESDDDESEYMLPNIDLKKNTLPPRDNTRFTLPNIDLKKNTIPPQTKDAKPVLNIGVQAAPPSMRTYIPDRKPTIQYFPPRDKQEKILSNDYDIDFRNKVNSYTKESSAVSAYTRKDVPPKIQFVPTQPTYRFPNNKFDSPNRPNEINNQQMDRNIYLTQSDPNNSDGYGVENQGEGVNRASYVIKHLRDFIDEVVRSDAIVITEVPVRGVTTNDAAKQTKGKPSADYYDYEAQFKKDVLDRFVENFNQNGERFRADFPVLYNSSIVHPSLQDGGREASSSAFMKRLYEDASAFQHAGKIPKRYDCERTVELSPAYELHYYVPEEEEKEQVEPKVVTTLPYRFRI